VACVAAGWMSLLDLGSNSMPTSCCTIQVRNPRQADSSDTLSTQITPANAADARRRCWRPRPAGTLHTYMPYTPVFAHITQLRSPPRNPARCESFKTRARVCAHHTCAAAGCAVCAAQPPIGQLLQPAATSAQPFRQRRPLRAKPQEAGLRTPACMLPARGGRACSNPNYHGYDSDLLEVAQTGNERGHRDQIEIEQSVEHSVMDRS